MTSDLPITWSVLYLYNSVLNLVQVIRQRADQVTFSVVMETVFKEHIAAIENTIVRIRVMKLDVQVQYCKLKIPDKLLDQGDGCQMR